jgi:hypothetical protein
VSNLKRSRRKQEDLLSLLDGEGNIRLLRVERVPGNIRGWKKWVKGLWF